MRYYNFKITVCFGEGDYGESEIGFEVTEEEYALLMEAKEHYDELSECPNLQDLYDRVYDAAYEQEKELALEFESLGEFEYEDDDEDDEYDPLESCSIRILL